MFQLSVLLNVNFLRFFSFQSSNNGSSVQSSVRRPVNVENSSNQNQNKDQSQNVEDILFDLLISFIHARELESEYSQEECEE